MGENGILVVEFRGARHKNYVSIIKNIEITSENAYFRNGSRSHSIGPPRD